MSTPTSDTPARRFTSAAQRYGLAVLSIAVALVVTRLLEPDALVTPLFFLAILLSAWVGGIGPGLLAAVLAMLAIDYFFLEPRYALTLDLAELPHLVVFLVSAVLVSSWSVARRRAETLLRQARDEQEAKVQERTADLKQANEKLQAEIAERRRVGETLRERADLLDLTHDTVFVRGMDDVITYWNRGAQELYGWTSEEAIERTSHDLLRTSFPAPLEEIHAELIRTGRWEGELIHAKRDGTRVVVASRWALQRDERGNPLAVLETNNDVTERKHAEEELRRSETFLAEAQRLSRTGSVGMNVVTGALYWSEETYRILGVDRGTPPTFELPLQRTHPDDQAAVRSAIGRAVRDATDLAVEHRLLMPDGAVKHLHLVARAARDDTGNLEFVGAVMDITERKRAEEELRESERRYRYIFQAAGVSIWEEDFSRVNAAIDGLKSRGVSDFRRYFAEHPEFVRRAMTMVKVVDVNDATVKLFGGRSKDELLGSLEKVFLPETEEVFAGELLVLSEGKTFFEAETALQTLHGDRLAVLFTITFPPEPAKLDSVLVTIMDITERKRAEEALQKAQAELAHVTRVTTMGELTSSIAHEVNQPLTAIVTNANAALRWLAAQPPNLAEARETVGRIARDGHRASEVVGRVRALFRKATTDKSRLDVNDLIQESVALVHGEARRNRAVLRTELADDISPVMGDRVQLQQVVLNLIINGVEAMGAVTGRPRELLVRTERDESDGVSVSVRDSGVGFDPQQADRLFDAFHTTKPEGMGMGLSVSRSIIEAHGGRLQAEPNEGHGATFRFTLPADGRGRHD